MKFIFIMISSFFIVGCDSSPINNKVFEDNKKTNGLIDLDLKLNKTNLVYEGRKLKLSLNWLSGPFKTSTKESVLVVSFFDKENNLFSFPDNIEIVFDAFMPSMGHGLDSSGYFKIIGEGVYRNDEVRFQMPGEWVMRVLIVDYDNFDSEPLEVFSWQRLI